MNDLIIAVITVAGTMTASFAGIMISNRLTIYRIEQLEKKVEKHNSLIERTALIERDLKTAFTLIDEMRIKRI